jgi:membrane protease YdiL (CAAX protease family)
VVPDGVAPHNTATEVATPLEYASGAPAPALAEVCDSKASRWIAVIITSAVFALVHPLWTAPLIFLLALCLGYAYERTGSLWVPITMHAMFNISSTFLFLNFM